MPTCLESPHIKIISHIFIFHTGNAFVRGKRYNCHKIKVGGKDTRMEIASSGITFSTAKVSYL